MEQISQEDSQESGRSRAVSPSNRGETTSLSKASLVGIDKLALSFRVKDFDVEPSAWSGHADRYSDDGTKIAETFSRTVELGDGASVFCSVLRRFEPSVLAPVHAKVEFNPSRVVDPEGFSLVGVEASMDACGVAVRSALPWVQPFEMAGYDSYKVRRIDVAKDFQGVMEPGVLIRGLGPIPRKWARRNSVFADPQSHGAQTLSVGSGAGMVRLYDKYEETGHKVEAGTVRWETQARGDWAEKYGAIRTAGDLTEENVAVLAADRWEWSLMGVEIKSTLGVVDLLAQSDLSEREGTMFLGWLVKQSTPHAFVPSTATLAKFRKIQREMNIVLGPDAMTSVGFSSRLDWDSGTVLTRVS